MADLTPDARAEWRRAASGPSHGVNINSRILLDLLDAADERDRLVEALKELDQEKRAEQVKRIKAEHHPFRVRGNYFCVVDEMDWPCLSIRNLEQPSEEMKTDED